MNKKFWIVWGQYGISSARYASKARALKEAMRLAGVEREQDFFVMEAVAVAYDKNKPVHVEHDEKLE